ncbi:MAG: PilN domain-containing protein [Gammaproteobacteria bacterium]|nr:PilN domain-containing protein [Gammaproteobacteria bacterium]
MPRINLLPWREELRKIRQKNFGIAAVGAVLAAAAILLGALAFYTAKIDYQNARNAYLDREIQVLNDQIKEIDELETVKERLIARMEIIEDLQTKRPEVVHLFDELVKAIPDGVHLLSVKQTGTRITISGIAQSSSRVSAFMRNIDSSPWLTNPDLNVVTTADSGSSGRTSSFTIVATQTSPGSTEESS